MYPKKQTINGALVYFGFADMVLKVCVYKWTSCFLSRGQRLHVILPLLLGVACDTSTKYFYSESLISLPH